ncbi:MAG TPA: ChbG/HpnK family deacetylase, partial [Burkholderiaceae bacterium]|nr:ChbG/HpnK family deacetylase [Burkholderiaceae bacterium]
MTRTLALCADDFGAAPGISAGIARLAHAQRLTALSCIVNSPHWPAAAQLLDGLPASVDVGLHLNLTEGRPLSARLGRHWPRLPGLPRLIVQAHLRLLPRAAVRRELHAQLAAFNQVMGRPPRFIDGHQHIHHLPGLRAMILDMVEHVQPLPALRSTARVLGPGFGLKRWLIEHTGGRALGRELASRVMARNPALLGAYDFADPNYQGLMRGWLGALPAEGGLVFCHPGLHLDGDPPDAIAAARERELAYLGSVAFDADLAA